MMRVSVIGCPGAGKTTFSKQLAKKAGLPLVHLDSIYHDPTYPYQTDKELWRAKVHSLVEQERWIIDGNYKSTFDLRFPYSDTIIFLDYPTHVSMWRAIKRRVQFREKVRDDMPATWKEKLGWKFILFILRFNHDDAPRIRSELEKMKTRNDIIILRDPKQAKAYLAEYNFNGH
jgi:adenylate kinase family enzyme